MSPENNVLQKRMSITPLSLYVHFPWCLNKCPYCDFNSYVVPETSFIATYVNKLLMDLETEARDYKNGELISIYFGGGTPSLLPPNVVAAIIQQVKNNFICIPEIEITLEANPGTVNLNLCQEFKNAGINRLSMGVQSFNDKRLKNIKRIHDAKAAIAAVEAVKQAGFVNFNLDLMYGLPGQNVISAIEDLTTALSFEPPHISWYQLTVESKLLFGTTSSELPYGEELWDIQQIGQNFLSDGGLKQYEVSAYCRSSNDRCKHNMNYWQYGDYIGIGAGAHGKITSTDYAVRRYAKISNPYRYLKSKNLIENEEVVDKEKLPLEFMLNALRLYQPISYDLFQKRTGFTIDTIEKQLQYAKNLGLVEFQDNTIFTTDHGKNFLNDLLEIFL